MFTAYTDASFKDGNIVVAYSIQNKESKQIISESCVVNSPEYQKKQEGIEAIAIIQLLERIIKDGLSDIKVHSDDLYLIRMLNGELNAKNGYVGSLLSKINMLKDRAGMLNFVWIPRRLNTIADQLCRHTMQSLGYIKTKEAPRLQEIVKEYAALLVDSNRDELTIEEKCDLLKKAQKASNIETILLRIDKHREVKLSNKEKIKYHNLDDVTLNMLSHIIEVSKRSNKPINKVKLKAFLNNIHLL